MIEKRGIRQSYSTGPYNKFNDSEQWVRISQGCPNHCPFCYEPQEMEWFGVPDIVRNDVHIMDMNLLAFPQAYDTIWELGIRRVLGRIIRYTLVCGIDYRFLNDRIASSLKESRFYDVRIAWDWWYSDQFKIQKAIRLLESAGFKARTDLEIFMICNWEIPYSECLKKLDLCKYWNVRVADCYFDGQVSPNIDPIGWTKDEIIDFRGKVRKHNQLVGFHIDPELKESNGMQRTLKKDGDDTR